MKNRLIQRLQILLKEQNATQHKAEIYASYGVKSSKEMTEQQLHQLIHKLEADKNSHSQSSVKTLRSEILKIITAPAAGMEHQRGLAIPNSWESINPFIKHHAGKRLPDMSIKELQSFKLKLYAIRNSGWHFKQGADPLTPAVPRVQALSAILLLSSTIVS